MFRKFPIDSAHSWYYFTIFFHRYFHIYFNTLYFYFKTSLPLKTLTTTPYWYECLSIHRWDGYHRFNRQIQLYINNNAIMIFFFRFKFRFHFWYLFYRNTNLDCCSKVNENIIAEQDIPKEGKHTIFFLFVNKFCLIMCISYYVNNHSTSTKYTCLR